MAYTPHTEADRQAMLAAIGVRSLADLFQDVPERFRYPDLHLPEALSEMEVLQEMEHLAGKNLVSGQMAMFLGAGAYHHFIPSVVPYLASRGEYATAYTPYQPEVSQGTLQSIFEYQSLMGRLTGMDVVNASHYDGATAMVEGALMAVRALQGKRDKILVSPSIHPQYRQTLRTYLSGDNQLQVSGDEEAGADLQDLEEAIDARTACVIVQNPDFFGDIHDLSRLSKVIHDAGALLVVVSNPITALGLLQPPGAYGADIVAAEGQPLGIPLSFGGPYLGVLGCREALVRRLPGRLVGETVDAEGRRGFVLTLTPREQHIRREKATSNICTNQGLMALMSGIYLACMGKQGLRLVAEMCYHKAHFAAQEIGNLKGYSVVNSGPFFNEFVIRCPKPAAEINQALLRREILGGYDLHLDYPNREKQMLLCVTENEHTRTNHQVGRWIEEGSRMTEPLIFELSSPGRTAFSLPKLDVPASALPVEFLRADLDLPEVSELDLVRHYTRLSQLNFAIDTHFYPLGSCTMKYNPKVNERTAALPGFSLAHPHQPAATVQGCLELMYLLQEALREIAGFAQVSLQPAAGRSWRTLGCPDDQSLSSEAREILPRVRMLIPDSAHGTNPASSAMAGFQVVEVPSDSRGNIDLNALKSLCGQDVAGLMLTNPNTLGLFEEHVLEVSEAIHRCGGLMYGDGRKSQRAVGHCTAGRFRYRCDALQSAQDFRNASRRRRPRKRTGRRFSVAGRLFARPDRSKRRPDIFIDLTRRFHRAGKSVSMVISACSCVL